MTTKPFSSIELSVPGSIVTQPVLNLYTETCPPNHLGKSVKCASFNWVSENPVFVNGKIALLLYVHLFVWSLLKAELSISVQPFFLAKSRASLEVKEFVLSLFQ